LGAEVKATSQLFAEQILDVVAKHNGAVRHDFSFQLIAAGDEPSTDEVVAQVKLQGGQKKVRNYQIIKKKLLC